RSASAPTTEPTPAAPPRPPRSASAPTTDRSHAARTNPEAASIPVSQRLVAIAAPSTLLLTAPAQVGSIGPRLGWPLSTKSRRHPLAALPRLPLVSRTPSARRQ